MLIKTSLLIKAQTQSSHKHKPINPVDYDYQNIEEDEDIYDRNNGVLSSKVF